MKNKNIFIIGKKFCNEEDFPMLEQAYSNLEYAQEALEIVIKELYKKQVRTYYVANKVISTQQEFEDLPDNCFYIRAMELI